MSELWDNPLLPIEDRLEIAAGAATYWKDCHRVKLDEAEALQQEVVELREQIDAINEVCDRYANRHSPEGWGPLLKPAGKVALCIQDADMLRVHQRVHDIEIAERVRGACANRASETYEGQDYSEPSLDAFYGENSAKEIRNLDLSEVLKDA